MISMRAMLVHSAGRENFFPSMEPGRCFQRPMAMTVFHIDSAAVSTMTDSLREDAAKLQLLHDVSFPATWPLGEFSAAVTESIAKANTDAEALRAEAHRIAAVMDLAVDAAAAVDTCTCQKLGVAL